MTPLPDVPEPPEAYRYADGQLTLWDPEIDVAAIEELCQGRYVPFAYDPSTAGGLVLMRVAHPHKPYAGYRYLAWLRGRDFPVYIFLRDLGEVTTLARATASWL